MTKQQKLTVKRMFLNFSKFLFIFLRSDQSGSTGPHSDINYMILVDSLFTELSIELGLFLI